MKLEEVKLKIVLIKTLQEYINWSQSSYEWSNLTLFRGQPVKGNLIPSIARKNPSYDTTNLERTMLNQFKLMGASMLMNIEKNSLELMVIAQHFGLQTRLLDWTANPLAALFFACNDPLDGDVYVYALESDSLLANDPYEKDPFTWTMTRVFQPPLNNPRITAQQGWFTLHRYASKASQFVPLEKNPEVSKYLSAVCISKEDRYSMIQSLARHGIGNHTLFPDLAGLSKHLNYTHSV